jgi:serine/threonine protein kinase
MFDSLAEILIEIQLLRREQWLEIRQRLASDSDLHTVLDRIQELPAWWAVGSAAPALTTYQRKWIKHLHEKHRLPRLARALRRGDYLILQVLGEGGIGIVFKAWDFRERRLVAIKQIKKLSTESYRRFRREARIQKRLTHPSIVRFHKLARVRGDTLLVQEYIEGRTIAEEVKARGLIPWQEAVHWILDVLRALEYAHRLKIIHRDLKPSNILLHKHAAGVGVKVLDLGLAKCLDPTSMTQTATKDVVTVGDALLGTFEYMAPEQWRGAEEIVSASDIYSLGCTLFYILMGGRPPFVADSLMAFCNAHTNSPPPRMDASRQPVPEALEALVRQMLSKDTAKRGSPTRLIKQFSKLLPRDPAKATAPSARTPLPRRPLVLPRLQTPPDERFLPFSPDSRVNVSGVRNFLRAFLVSRGLFRRILFLLLIALAVAGILWLCFRT